MQRIRRAAAVMVAAVMFCYCAAARAEGVMDQVPADALVVVKVNRLEQTNQKAGKWTEALGLAQLSPDAADPLGALQNKLGIKEGIDRKGDLAIVFLAPAGGKGAPAKQADADADADEGGANKGKDSVLILVPTTDYKAFTGGLPNAKTQGNITAFHTEENANEPGYVANWGKYAAMSPSKTLVQNKPQGALKVTGLAARELQEKDVVVYANIPAIRAKALPQLQKLRQQMKQQMQNGGGVGFGTPAKEGAGDATGDDSAATTPAPRPQRGTGRTPPAGGNRNAPGRRPGSPGARADEPATIETVGFVEAQRQTPAPGRAPRAAQPQPGADNNGDDSATPAQNRTRRGRPGAAPGPNESQQMAQMMGPMIDQYFAMAERVLTDGQAATFSLTLSNDGLNTTAMAEFTPNSYMGNVAKDLKNTDQPLMAGLPDRKYFAFGGATISGKAMNQLFTDFMQPMLKQMQGGQGGQAAGNAQELLDGTKQVMDNAKSMAFGYTVPTGPLGTESVIQAITVVNGNAKAIAEGERKVIKNMNLWLQGMPQMGGAAGAGAPKMNLEFLPNSKTVAGVKLEQFRMNMDVGDANNPQAAQIQQMMAMMYGPNGLTGSMGAVSDNTFLMVQGGTDKLINDAVTAAKANQDAMSKSQPVQAVRGEMPKQRVAEFYIALDQIISSAVKYAQGLGAPVKMQLPQGLAPIGITAASEGTAVRIDSHVPTQLIQSVVAAGMQAYMQMQGGGAGAPDGL